MDKSEEEIFSLKELVDVFDVSGISKSPAIFDLPKLTAINAKYIRNMSDEEILSFYEKVRDALAGKEFKILYLKAEDLRGNLQVIRKERSDENGVEMWFPLMMQFFDNSPYAKARDLSGEDALIEHFAHRQELELKICEVLFAEKTTVLPSKGYGELEGI